jgi:hypothetical protein
LNCTWPTIFDFTRIAAVTMMRMLLTVLLLLHSKASAVQQHPRHCWSGAAWRQMLLLLLLHKAICLCDKDITPHRTGCTSPEKCKSNNLPEVSF